MHTPTVAIIFSLGLLYTTQCVDKKQLIHLQQILLSDPNDWPHRFLIILKEKGYGWFAKIQNTLEKYNLPTDFETIKSTPIQRWHNHVTAAIDIKNQSRIKEDLYKMENGDSIPKTKPKTIIEKISDPNYTQQPDQLMIRMTKLDTKTLMMARYGMLQCGKNFKGTLQPICNQCSITDNKQHRLNI